MHYTLGSVRHYIGQVSTSVATPLNSDAGIVGTEHRDKLVTLLAKLPVEGHLLPLSQVGDLTKGPPSMVEFRLCQ